MSDENLTLAQLREKLKECRLKVWAVPADANDFEDDAEMEADKNDPEGYDVWTWDDIDAPEGSPGKDGIETWRAGKGSAEYQAIRSALMAENLWDYGPPPAPPVHRCPHCKGAL